MHDIMDNQYEAQKVRENRKRQ